MSRLSNQQAAELIEILMDCSVDLLQSGLIEAYVLNRSVDEARDWLAGHHQCRRASE